MGERAGVVLRPAAAAVVPAMVGACAAQARSVPRAVSGGPKTVDPRSRNAGAGTSASGWSGC